MDHYLIYLAPYIAIGVGIMLAPFVSDSWPKWLEAFVEWCAVMVNGVWIAGIVAVLLFAMSVPIPLAIVLSWPVMHFSGHYIARMSDRMDERTRAIKREGWEAHRQKDDDAQ